jgi:hypothetical protein
MYPYVGTVQANKVGYSEKVDCIRGGMDMDSYKNTCEIDKYILASFFDC